MSHVVTGVSKPHPSVGPQADIGADQRVDAAQVDEGQFGYVDPQAPTSGGGLVQAVLDAGGIGDVELTSEVNDEGLSTIVDADVEWRRTWPFQGRVRTGRCVERGNAEWRARSSQRLSTAFASHLSVIV